MVTRLTNALEIKKLTKVFGDRKALDRVTFDLPEGAFLSIFGPNGAGKTTLLRILSTLSRPTQGSVRVMGIDAKEEPDQVRGHIGLISHNSMLYPDLTAMENLMFVARLYGVVNPEERVRYVVTGESGPDHNKHFIVEVHLNSNCIGRGEGHSKKQAEQSAAREALSLMGY